MDTEIVYTGKIHLPYHTGVRLLSPKNVFVFKPIVTYLMTHSSQLIPNSFNFSFFLDHYMLKIYHALCLTKPTKTELQVLN